MTQDYDIEYIATYSDPKYATAIEGVLKAHSWDTGRDISHFESQIVVDGYQDLHYPDPDASEEMGDMEKVEYEEILKELKAIDPKVKLETKWHYCTGWEWDYEYGEGEEEGPPSDDARQTAGSVPAF